MKVTWSFGLLIGTVLLVAKVKGNLCPKLSPPSGTELHCSHDLGRLVNCSTASLPLTQVRVTCQAYYKSSDGGSTDRFLKCGRSGKWRKERKFGNFSCHLDADGFVEKLIHSQKILIFSRSTCGYCQETKGLFDHLGEKYMSVEVDHLEPHKMNLLRDALWRKTKMRTWPNVFVNGYHVGGNDATTAAYKNGQLLELLRTPSITKTSHA